MKLCEAHEKTFVIYSSADCPLCRAEKAVKDAQAGVGRAMGILQEIQQEVEKLGVKSD